MNYNVGLISAAERRFSYTHIHIFGGELGFKLRVHERLLHLRAVLRFEGHVCETRTADTVLPRSARSALLAFLGVLVSPCPFRPSQKQLTQDDDADEVEIAVDNTAFMDEFFSEVGALPLCFF